MVCLQRSEAWCGASYLECTRAALPLWSVPCCWKRCQYVITLWKGSGNVCFPEQFTCVLMALMVNLILNIMPSCSCEQIPCFKYYICISWNPVVVVYKCKHFPLLFPCLLFFPAELVAAVQYFEQRQQRERETQQCQYKSKEVRERISFLKLQAQVKLTSPAPF